MIRRVIHIDHAKCNGCGICANACHEGAIGIVDGKAQLLRDDYCDGLGDCLPSCPAGAITFVEREAAAYDEEAVKAHMERRNQEAKNSSNSVPKAPAAPLHMQSRLTNWPVQIKLAPVLAPYFNNARLLIAADCTAYAYANFHQEFLKGKVALIGCPKLDDVDYSEKLTEIIKNHEIRSVTIVRMEVPCCGGLQQAAMSAIQNSGKFIPWQVVTISIDGKILDQAL